MVNYNQTLIEFKRRFGHLKNLGLQMHEIGNLIDDYHVISISTPFFFDHRQIPEKFMGLDVRRTTPENEMPPEFQNIDSDSEYIWAYQRFEEFVDKNADLIRKSFDKPEMTRNDMLDAVCFGNFKKHKEACLRWESNGTIPKWKK